MSLSSPVVDCCLKALVVLLGLSIPSLIVPSIRASASPLLTCGCIRNKLSTICVLNPSNCFLSLCDNMAALYATNRWTCICNQVSNEKERLSLGGKKRNSCTYIHICLKTHTRTTMQTHTCRHTLRIAHIPASPHPNWNLKS